jgi:hypothetical protein
MAGASITQKGLDEILRGLNALPQYVGDDVRDSLKPVVDDMKDRLAIYPAQRAGQRYVRSGDLGRGWVNAQPQFVVRGGGGVDMRLENRVDYAGWVQGEAQAWMHAGRWQTAASVLTAFEDDLTNAVEDGAVRALRRARLT